MPSFESIYNFRGKAGAHLKAELQHLAVSGNSECSPLCVVERGLGFWEQRESQAESVLFLTLTICYLVAGVAWLALMSFSSEVRLEMYRRDQGRGAVCTSSSLAASVGSVHPQAQHEGPLVREMCWETLVKSLCDGVHAKRHS